MLVLMEQQARVKVTIVTQRLGVNPGPCVGGYMPAKCSISKRIQDGSLSCRGDWLPKQAKPLPQSNTVVPYTHGNPPARTKPRSRPNSTAYGGMPQRGDTRLCM